MFCLESAFELSNDDSTDYYITKPHYKNAGKMDAQEGIKPEIKAEAEKLKNDGNNLMQADKYKEAYEKYTKAIELDSQNAVFFCNRAAALLKLNDYQGAETDCLAALEMDNNYGKAYSRLGVALFSLNKYFEAHAVQTRALQLEPGNEIYQNNLRLTEEKLSGNPHRLQQLEIRAMDLVALLQSPAFVNMASDMLSDSAMQNIMSGFLNGTAQANDAEMSRLLEAGQLLAQQVQQVNPELLNQLQRQIDQGQPPQNPPPSQ